MNAYKWKQTKEDAEEERHDVVCAYLCVQLSEEKKRSAKGRGERERRRGIREQEAEWNKVGREE